MGFQIAIDGPAGAGKSTVARAAAERLGCLYVDTGAMYRAVGLYFLDHGTDTEDQKAVRKALDQAEITLRITGGVQHVFLNGADVTDRVRTEQAGMMASRVSAIAAVREKMVSMQQEIARTQDVVMDGRDIGTVVLPSADLKIFLTASTRTRAERRYRELKEKGQRPDLQAIEEDIRKRDNQDMHRAVSPLRQAADAVLLDSSDLDAGQVTERIVSLTAERKASEEGTAGGEEK